ncbi:hypothetical protein QTP70_016133, partial [Hemibagrus guttatus]
SCSQTLIQSDPVIIKPDQSHKLTCTASGLDFDNYWMACIRQVPGKGLELVASMYSSSSNYCTGGIQQPAGKTLEWIGNICYDGSTYYSEKLKSRVQVSRDTSSSTVTLTGQNMQTEDTAVYYCARYTQ